MILWRQKENISKSSCKKYRDEFFEALDLLADAVGVRLFRPTRVLNAAAFDSILVTVAENLEVLSKNKNKLKKNYELLLSDNEYKGLVTKSTADEQSVSDRFDIANNFLLRK